MKTAAEHIDAARAVSIERIIERRSIELRGKKIERVGSCPRCGGTDRFSINIRKQLWNCRGCQKGGDVIALVEHVDGVDFKTAVEILTGQAPDKAASRTKADDYERQQHHKAGWLWSQRKPIKDSLAERYLQGRGYRGALPPTLGFLPPRKSEYFPAMIAALGLCDEAEPGVIAAPRDVGCVHLTLLKPDGSGKADRTPNKFIVGSPQGLPIVLAPPNDLLGLAITEGIEDALIVHQATGLGAWAGYCAGNMAKLAPLVPAYIEAVTIYAHNDEAGQRAARELAQELIKRGTVETFIEGIPP